MKGRDFLRIDGSVDSGRRGDLVDDFNCSEDTKAFLISSLAGGIGINLCSAAVVVMMDNHFNPSVSSQCISRAHRLGQKKPVYCFRLSMEGTMEAKIYARCVNKEGVAMQVVDGKFSESQFKQEEIDDLQKSNTIIECDLCGKRRLVDQVPLSDDGGWNCTMNSDPRFNACHKKQQVMLKKIRRGPMPVRDNYILEHLTQVVNNKTRRKELVLDYIPVRVTEEAGLCCEDAISKLKDDMSNPGSKKRKVPGGTKNRGSTKKVPAR